MKRDRYYLLQDGYQRWTIKELRRVALEDESIPVRIVVERFIRKMERYMYLNTHTSWEFSVARDMAIHILDLIITENIKTGGDIK